MRIFTDLPRCRGPAPGARLDLCGLELRPGRCGASSPLQSGSAEELCQVMQPVPWGCLESPSRTLGIDCAPGRCRAPGMEGYCPLSSHPDHGVPHVAWSPSSLEATLKERAPSRGGGGGGSLLAASLLRLRLHPLQWWWPLPVRTPGMDLRPCTRWLCDLEQRT